jgi:hypothetical protein
MSPRPIRIVSAALVSLALLASCGDDEETDSDATEAVDESDDNGSDDTDADTDSDDTDADTPETAAGDISDGGCHVTVTGDVTKEWTGANDSGGFAYGPWADAALGDNTVPFSITLDANFFILNCTSGDDNVSFTASGDFQVPQEPATYALAPSDNIISGASPDNEIGMIISLAGTDTNWGLEAEGTFTITEFDDEHIAGTFELPVKDNLADLASVPSKGSALIKGEFLFTNQS